MDRRKLGWTSLFSALGALLLLLTFPIPLHAGITGKISGRIIDQKREPLPGVTVQVPDARLGAMTDADGRYTILNVPAGKYVVKLNMLGYRPVSITDVTVSADKTTRLDQEMQETPLAMPEVVVSAKAPVVDVRQTSSVVTVSRDVIAQLPVQELADVVNLQAGVVDGHFRGGRLGEVQYQVDGISVNNSYDNKSTLRIDRSLLEEVQVISGTFDAEYGQAMSGVVNAVLKRGSAKLEWNAEVFSGGFLYPGSGKRLVPVTVGVVPDTTAPPDIPGPQEIRRDMDQTFRPAGIQNYQASLTGPTGLPKTAFLLSARRYIYNDWTYGRRLFRPTDKSDRLTPVYRPTGDGEMVPLGYTREWSGVGKVTSRLAGDLIGRIFGRPTTPNIEVGYQAIGNVVEARRSDWAFNLNPDGLSKQHTFSIVHGLDWTHALGKKSFYTLAVRQNYFDYMDHLYEPWDTMYDAAEGPKNRAGFADNAVIQGVQFTQFKQNTNALVLKGSFVSQLNSENQVKAGGEFQFPRLQFGNLANISQQGDGPVIRRYPGLRVYTPVQGAAFAQEQLEWNDLNFRAGVRLDYFNARSSVPGDLKDPANVLDTVFVPPQPTTAKVALSPRVGVSYPISPRASIYFAYGHFYQMPGLGDVFNNADYSQLAILSTGNERDFGVLGNPDIKPEWTVQYQGGYKHALSEDLGLSLDLFYKDIRDLLGVEFIQAYNVAEYARLTNVDNGSVLGFTAAFDLRPRGLLSGSVSYTWQKAQGNASDPRETATRAEAGEDPRPRQVPLNWDQRHTVNLTATLARPGDFSASAVLRVASGQPYTPTLKKGFAGGLETNSGRKPMGVLLDLRGEKSVRWERANVSVFARAFNVFDTKFFNGSVFGDTGSPYYSLDPEGYRFAANDPTRFYAPRRVEVGLTLSGPR